MQHHAFAALIILLLAPALTLTQQASADTQSNTLQWTATYQRPPSTLQGLSAQHRDSATSFIQTSDSGYLIAGNTEDAVGLPHTGGFHAYSGILLKTDSAGNMQWQKENDSFAYTLAITQTDNFTYTILTPRGYLLKVDSQGNISSSRRLDVLYSAAYPTMDGGFLLTFLQSDASAIAKIDGDGNVLSNQTLFVLPNEYIEREGISNIAPTHDGNYFLACWDGTRRAQTCEPNLWLLKVDTNGTLLYSKSFSFNASNPTYGDPIQSSNPPTIGNVYIASTQDGGCLLAGTADFYSFYVPFFVKLNSNGNWEWSRLYTEINGNARLYSVVQASNFDYVAVGAFWNFTYADELAFIMDTGIDGARNWNQTFPAQAFGNAYSIIDTSDGGYAVLGAKNYEIFLSKFASVLPPATPTPTPTKAPQSSNLSTNVAIGVVIIAIALVGVLVYLNKHRH
jgi:hypothetical protein